MAATELDTHAPTHHTTQHPFPEELPPRKSKQTWLQRNKFHWRTFFTLHWRSFSVRNRHGARDVWRRISMWLIQLSRLAMLAMFATLGAFNVYLGPDAIVLLVFVLLVALLLLAMNAWCLALIAEATGTRRAMGVTVRRNGLDWFLHIMAFLHVGSASVFIFWGFWYITMPTGWIFLGLVMLIAALVAGKEPLDGVYSIGV